MEWNFDVSSAFLDGRTLIVTDGDTASEVCWKVMAGDGRWSDPHYDEWDWGGGEIIAWMPMPDPNLARNGGK
jgi:hypothetical protein